MTLPVPKRPSRFYVDCVGLRDHWRSSPTFSSTASSPRLPHIHRAPRRLVRRVAPLGLSIKIPSLPSLGPKSTTLGQDTAPRACLFIQLLASTPNPRDQSFCNQPRCSTMAPSVLLDQESPPPSYIHPAKQTLKEAQAPSDDGLSFTSDSSINANGNSSINGSNGFPVDNGLAAGQPGGDFITVQTLRQQSENYASQTRSSDNAKSPNILYIMADQMAAPMLKFNDPESVIKTPHLDELARTGVNFASAYCNSPLCAPSRFTMCSGQLPSKIGGYDNASILGPEAPTYAHYLRRQGYETALAGKMHFIGPDQLHGFEHRLTSDIYPGDLGWSVNWDKPEERQEWYHNMSSVMQAGPCVRSNQLDYDEDVMHKVSSSYVVAR